MKITLLSPPPHPGKRAPERVSGCAYVIYHVPNIYALSVASVLEQAGHTLRHLDAALESWNQSRFQEFLATDDSDCYLIYSVNLAKRLDIETAKLIHHHRPLIPIVFMGPAPSDQTADFLVDQRTYVVRGEPEFSCRELCAALADGNPVASITGVSWSDSGGKPQHNAPRPLIENLDDLPFPARHLIDREKYFNPKLGITPYTAIATSRGCANHCIYCVPSSLSFATELEHKRQFGCKPRVRRRSVDSITAEFEAIAKAGFRSVSIQDDQFVWDRDQTVELCRRIAPLGLAWGCSCRADRLDETVIKAMAAAGCVYIDIGVESFDSQVLRFIRKGYDDPAMVERVIRLIQRYGIKAKINILFGASPAETLSTIRRTIREIRRIAPDQVMYDIVNPFPGTEFHELAKREGWFRYGDYVPVDVGRQSIIQLPRISARNLERAVRYANLTFFFNPRFMFRNLFRLRSWTQLKNSLHAMYRKLFAR